MPSPAELRQTSRSFEWVAEQERDPHLKQRLPITHSPWLNLPRRSSAGGLWPIDRPALAALIDMKMSHERGILLDRADRR